MREVSQNEFEQLIRKVLDKEVSMKQLIEDLETSYSNINNKITEMRESNPELYNEYITKRPYRPKRNLQLNSEALVTQIIIERLTLIEASEEYEIPVRTINRRISEVKKQNPALYNAYKRYQSNKQLTIEDEEVLQKNRNMVKAEKGADDLKLDELTTILKKYESLVAENNGLSNYQAAAELGFIPQQIDEMYKKVKRITTQKSFKEQIKVTPEELNPSSIEQGTKPINEPEKEK